MSDPRQHEKYESYEGGSAEAERLVFEELARKILRVQAENQRSGKLNRPVRAFHAKAPLAVDNARLRFYGELPRELREGYAQPGAAYRAVVRMSNASGIPQADAARDLRGIAVRIVVTEDERHDLLMLNLPASHAANAREFVGFASVMAGAAHPLRFAWRLLVKLPREVGWSTANRMRRTLRGAVGRRVTSLATERYWGQGPVLWGGAGPVQYQLRPGPGAADRGKVPADRKNPEYLHAELAGRLRDGDIAFELCLQRFVDERSTPVEDASHAWDEETAPAVPVAELTIPGQDIDSEQARGTARRIEQLAFTPWRTTDAFRPLGSLNRSRDAAYGESSSRRLGQA
ncbi:hypothetical protein [Streptomyces sp. NPDC005408]|uniref:hypothetical protein n=1 Tax=Streptomyces sp. NPDC005408 TaxID=3155341 RepID=UPI0033BB8CE8